MKKIKILLNLTNIKSILIILSVFLCLLISRSITPAAPGLSITVGNQIESNSFIDTEINVAMSHPRPSGWQLYIAFPDSMQGFSHTINLQNNGLASKFEVIPSQSQLTNPENYTQIDSGVNRGIISKSYTIRYIKKQNDYEDSYNCLLNFKLNTGTSTQYQTVTYRINIPKMVSVYTDPTSNNIKISFDANEIFKPNYEKKSNEPSNVYVSANTNWQLLLTRNKDNNPTKLNFKISTLPTGVTSSYTNDYYPINENQSLIVAKGPKCHVNDNGLIPWTIPVEYELITSTSGIMTSGNYTYDLHFSSN